METCKNVYIQTETLTLFFISLFVVINRHNRQILCIHSLKLCSVVQYALESGTALTKHAFWSAESSVYSKTTQSDRNSAQKGIMTMYSRL